MTKLSQSAEVHINTSTHFIRCSKILQVSFSQTPGTEAVNWNNNFLQTESMSPFIIETNQRRLAQTSVFMTMEIYDINKQIEIQDNQIVLTSFKAIRLNQD